MEGAQNAALPPEVRVGGRLPRRDLKVTRAKGHTKSALRRRPSASAIL
jgi:hypothetical protein